MDKNNIPFKNQSDQENIQNTANETNDKNASNNNNDFINKNLNYNQSTDEQLISQDESSYTPDKTRQIEILLDDPDLMESSSEETGKRNELNFFRRFLAKMGIGSLRRIIFNLTFMNLGITVFTLPEKTYKMNFIVFIIIILLIGVTSRWTLIIFTKLRSLYKKKTYELIIKKIYGNVFYVIINIFIILYNFAIIILSQFLIYYLVTDMSTIIGDQSLDNENNFYLKLIILFGIAYLILLPLCQINNASFLRKLSMIGIFLIIIIFMISIAYCIYNLIEHELDFSNIFNFENYIKKNINNPLFNSFPTLFFVFSYHDFIFPFLDRLHSPNKRRIRKIINRTIIADIITYLIMGLIGFLAVNDNEIIGNHFIIFHKEVNLIFEWVLRVGRCLFFLYILIKINDTYLRLRTFLLNIFEKDPMDISIKLNLIISFLVFGCSTIITVFIQNINISEMICLIGAIFSGVISFILPLLIYIKTNDKSILHYKNLFAVFLIIVFSCICFGSIIFTTMEKIEK